VFLLSFVRERKEKAYNISTVCFEGKKKKRTDVVEVRLMKRQGMSKSENPPGVKEKKKRGTFGIGPGRVGSDDVGK